MNKHYLSLLGTLLLVACASTTSRSSSTLGYLAGEGVPSAAVDELVDIYNIPDAVPKDEPLHPFANLPYTMFGKSYTPMLSAVGYKERGIASWYGTGFEGNITSSGEVCELYTMTAAHNLLPIPSYVRVTHLGNGKSVVVKINDRGPFRDDRLINLSYVAAKKLDMIELGTAEVEVESVMPDSRPLLNRYPQNW
ncbi:MAG: septal ring lytic transglycosylase RlpA family protein [Gallionella sp.]|nr:septal ring lytic transglycosylase RlpA family protein [Gallionella sp.]